MRSRDKKNASEEKRVKGIRVVVMNREEQGNEVKRWKEK